MWAGVATSAILLTPALQWAAKRDTKVTSGAVSTHRDAGLILLAGVVAAVPGLIGGIVGRRPRAAAVTGAVCVVVAAVVEAAVAVITWPTF